MSQSVALAFDTSTTGAGAILDSAGHLVALEEFKFGTHAGDAALDRLFTMAKSLGAVVAAEHPVGGHQRYEIRIIAAAESKIFLLEYLCRQHGVKYAGSVNPSTSKLGMTGDGHASKEKMMRFALVRYGRQCSEHEADAIACAGAAQAGRFEGAVAAKKPAKASNVTKRDCASPATSRAARRGG